MKVGDLVKYGARHDVSGRDWLDGYLGFVVEVASGGDPRVKRLAAGDPRVKWFGVRPPYWVSQKNLELVSESR